MSVVAELGGLGQLTGFTRRHEMYAAAWLSGYDNARTRESYALSMRTWFGWCDRNGVDPLDCRRFHVDLFIRQLEFDGLKPRTLLLRITALAQFYRYCVDEGIATRNPTRGVRRPKVERRSPTHWLKRPQLHDLLEAAAQLGPHPHALISLLVFNGLRISEAASLDVTSVGHRGLYPVITFRRKGGNTATLGLAIPTAAAVATAIGTRTDGPLILTSYGTRTNQKAAQRIIDKCLIAVRGEHGRITPHALRHSWCTVAMQAGVNGEQIRHDGGWTDMRMVSYYSHDQDDPSRSSTHAVAGLVLSA